MGIFDYREYDSKTSIELAKSAYQLAVASQLDQIFGLDTDKILESLTAFFGDGFIDVDLNQNLGLPQNWRDVASKELGYTLVDKDGYYIIPSPITGVTYSGPQAKVYANTDASGRVIGLSVSFAGTNSPLDVIDYVQLNEGTIAKNMEPLLMAVAKLAGSYGLASDDIIFTGYSLGGGYTNVAARFADSLAGGFFAGSSYIAYASPIIYEGNDRVLNIGYENDVVFRAAGSFQSLWEAVEPSLPFLSGSDYNLKTSTDNIIHFGDSFASPLWPFGPFSVLNLFGGWAAHIEGIFSDGFTRIANSHYYDLTEEDSIVILSNLNAINRALVWVEDKATLASNHVGRTAFLIGSQYNDKISGAKGNDYLDLGAGDDIARFGRGYDNAYGGSGTDTLQLDGSTSDWKVMKLGGKVFAFFSEIYGLKIVEDFETVFFRNQGLFGTNYHFESNRLEDDHWSLFEWGDKDKSYSSAMLGTALADTITVASASNIFGFAGDDKITGSLATDLINGGSGNDSLQGRGGNDHLYGSEGRDLINGGAGNDLLSGGLGDDTFVFVGNGFGKDVITDFNQSANEHDHLRFIGIFDNYQSFLSHAHQSGDNLMIDWGTNALTIENLTLSELSKDSLIFV